MFDKLVRTLDKSLSLTIHATVAKDFLDYSKLLDSLYWLLMGNIKTNHIFSWTGGSTWITIRQSNLKEHQEYVLNLWKRGTWDKVTWAQVIEHADKVLKPIQCVGLNPYKIVEMYKNYRPNILIEYHSDAVYTDQMKRCGWRWRLKRQRDWSLGQTWKQKIMRGRSKLKAWHSAMVRLRRRRVSFFSRRGFIPHQ